MSASLDLPTRTPIGRAAQFALLLTFAILIRCPAWGEWNFGIDDQFYAYVGERMRGGALLYVDVWDRKGPLLYFIFTLIGLISPRMLAYQVVATIFAGLGGYGVNRIARFIVRPRAAMLAGITYLALMSRFEGDNLEAGVFFNPLTIAAAWTVISRFDLLRKGRIDGMLVAGFLCAGLAIIIKQTAVFEGVLFGVVAVALMLRPGVPRVRIAVNALVLAGAGALPLMMVAAFYWHVGHFSELWSAMVTSNFARSYADPSIRILRTTVMAGMLAIPLVFAMPALQVLRDPRSPHWPVIALVAAWAFVTLTLLFLFPNIYVHYAQSSLPPLSILCAWYFAHKRPLWLALVALVGLSLALSGTFRLADRWRARSASAEMADYVRQVTPNRRLLVWGAPTYLYAKVGAVPVGPLPFAPHLFEGREWSGYDTRAEMGRILSARPETVVAQTPLVAAPLNEATVAMVERYKRTCAHARLLSLYDHNGRQDYTVFSECTGR